jgi:hypothetical protein
MIYSKLSVVVHAYNPSIQKAEAGDLMLELLSKTMSQNEQTKKRLFT